ncbi:EamA family transporter [Silvibacterium sp.]|uniref:EamA family transporter n=1 Tax=Silvibacterium sp. TaxID=1964179 RepID=UPI0039E515AB
MAEVEKSGRIRTATAFLLTGLLWGSAWIAEGRLRDAVPDCYAGPIPGISLEAARYGIAAAALGLLALRDLGSRISQKAILWAAMLGVVQLGVPFVLAAWSGSGVAPGISIVSFALMPLFALLISGGNGEGEIPLAVAGVGGVTLLGATSLNLSWHAWPMFLALLAAVLLGAVGLLGLRRLRVHGLIQSGQWAQFCAIQSGTACLFLLLASFIFHSADAAPCTLQRASALPLVALALPVTAVTLPLLFLLAGRMEAWQIATLEWLTTLVAVLESHGLLKIRPSWLEGLGAAILAGCIVRVVSIDESSATPVPSYLK